MVNDNDKLTTNSKGDLCEVQFSITAICLCCARKHANKYYAHCKYFYIGNVLERQFKYMSLLLNALVFFHMTEQEKKHSSNDWHKQTKSHHLPNNNF